MADRELQVGDVLWYVPSDKRWDKPHAVTVEKVGRVWADLGRRFRIDKRTLVVDGRGYTSPGRCYWSKAEWNGIAERCKAWDHIKEAIRYGGPPDGVTIEAIQAAANLLGVTLPSIPSQEVSR